MAFELPPNWSNTSTNEQVEQDFADNSLSHYDLAQKHGKSWDQVQRTRSKWRLARGLGQLPRGPKNNDNLEVTSPYSERWREDTVFIKTLGYMAELGYSPDEIQEAAKAFIAKVAYNDFEAHYDEVLAQEAI